MSQLSILRYLDAASGLKKHALAAAVGAAFLAQPVVAQSAAENSAPRIETKQLPKMVEGSYLSDRIKATDKDGDKLTFRLIKGPRGLTVNSAGTLQYEPGFDAAGEHDVVVEVSDGKESAKATLKLYVANVNRAPEFTSSSAKSVTEGETYRYQLRASDADRDSISFDIANAPSGMTLKGDTIEWEPETDQSGTYTFSAYANDGEERAEQTITLVVENSNRPPEFKTTRLPAGKEGVDYQASVEASDVDGDAVIFSLLAGPDGLKVSEAGDVSWTPDYDAAGRHTVILSISDGELTAKEELTLEVANTNQAPVWITSVLPEGKENTAYKTQLKANDIDGDKILYRLSSGPEGVAVSESGVLTFAPGFDAAGEHWLVLEVTDGVKTTPLSLVLTVENTNREPEWQQAATAQSSEGQTLTLPLAAQDPDEQTIEFELVSGPKGLILNEFNELSWNIDYHQAGDHEIVVDASDGESKTRHTIKLTVANTNRAPEFVTAALPAATENQPLSHTFKATDIDKDELTWELISAPQGVTLSKAGVLTWQPGFDAAGLHSIDIRVTDGELDARQVFELDVANVNRKPTWQTKALTDGKENQPWVFDLKVSDVDGEPLTIELIDGPEGMTLTGEQLQWAPDYDASGKYTIKLRVSDQESQVDLTLPLVIKNTNRMPEFSSAPEISAVENTAYEYPLVYADADGDDLVASLIQGPAGMAIKDGKLVWQPGFTAAGDHNVTLAVAEKGNPQAKTEQTFVVSVANTNRPVVWKTTELKPTAEMKAYQVQLAATDADGQTINYSLVEGPQGVELSDTGLLTFTPDYDQAGEHTLVIEATDGEEAIAASFNLVVANTNRLPSFSSEPVVIGHEDSPYSYTILATDADADPVTLSLVSGPKGMRLEGDQLIWTPSYTQAGKHKVVIAAKDGQGTTQHPFTVVVENTNRMPEMAVVKSEQLVLQEGKTWQLPLTLSDADGQAITASLVSGPEGLSLNGKTLVMKPGFEQAGSYDVIVALSDGESTIEQNLALEVENTNRTPKATSKPVLTAKENEEYSYSLQVADADLSGHEGLQFELLEAPEGMSLGLGETLEWLPTFDQAGKHNVRVSITDGESTIEQAFTITVANTNRAPVFGAQPASFVDENSRFEHDLSAVDPDGNKLTIKAEKIPAGMKLDGQVLSWDIGFKDAGEYPIAIVASDGSLSTRLELTLTVNNVNRLPEITSKPSKAAHESVAYNYSLAATDADDESLSFELESGPTGMHLENNQLVWMPGYGQSGNHQITVSVTDGLDVVRQSYTLSVDNTNREPELASIPNQRLEVGETFQKGLEATDVDGGSVAFKLIYGPKGMSLVEGAMLQWTPNASDIGDHEVIIMATDGDLKVRKHFDIRVTEASGTY